MAFQFKIQLKNISKPPVWRRVLVPENFTFHHLHKVIQAAFGWYNCHLYEFSPQGIGSYPYIGIPSEFQWDEEPDMNSTKTKLTKIFKSEKQTFVYTYDFGDDWKHKITLELITDDKLSKKATCIGGKGACPPEDCGGTWGYESFLETISDPNHNEYHAMREWAGLVEGQTWNDFAGFNLEKTNLLLSYV